MILIDFSQYCALTDENQPRQNKIQKIRRDDSILAALGQLGNFGASGDYRSDELLR